MIESRSFFFLNPAHIASYAFLSLLYLVHSSIKLSENVQVNGSKVKASFSSCASRSLDCQTEK